MEASLGELLHRAEPDELVREIDRCCSRGDHDAVLALRDGCRRATEELGKQLWGPAQYAEYRLALEAPAPLAAEVVTPGAGRFALGPLTEVVAQHHRFDELAEHLAPPVVGVVAQERVLRGEDLCGDPRAALDDTGLPGILQPWEPVYPVPTYRSAERIDDGPAPARARPRPLDAAPGPPLAAPELTAALTDLVAPWRDESTGEVHVAAVAGSAEAVVAALLPDEARVVELGVDEAMARMAWAAASGGAHGRRRGGAAGRAAAWWVAHVATGLRFPADPSLLGGHLGQLRWCGFDEGGEPAGWHLRLVVAGAEWAAAVDARDRRDDRRE